MAHDRDARRKLIGFELRGEAADEIERAAAVEMRSLAGFCKLGARLLAKQVLAKQEGARA